MPVTPVGPVARFFMIDVSIHLLCSEKPGTLSRIIRDIKLFGLFYKSHSIEYRGNQSLIVVNSSGELNCTQQRLIELLGEFSEVIKVKKVSISSDGEEVTDFRTTVSDTHIKALEPLSPAILLTAEKRLSEIIGPIASLLVETAFEIPELLAPATIDISLHTVVARVVFGTDLRSLVPSITVSEGAVINPESGVATDFSRPVIYTVTADDGRSMQEWTVTVTAGTPRSETDITLFSIPELIAPANIHSEFHLVTGTVPFGTDLRALVPSIVVSDGAAINPVSGAVTDFSTPVTYTVTAEDGTTFEHWLVTIQDLPSTETDIMGFSLAEQTGVYRIIAVDHTVEIEVVKGTDVTSLAPTISVSFGATIEPVSGVSRDFTNSAEYIVTAEDGFTDQEWTTTVTVELPNTETDITSFHIPELSAIATIDNSMHTIVGSVPFGTDLTALVPSIALSEGATVDPVSGTATDFSSPVTYTVTAEDGSTFQDWLVSLSLDPAVGIGTRNAESFRIYPNPATDFVFIELTRETNIRLHDMLGKLCYSEDHVTGNLTINISDFKRGVYIVSLVWEDGSLQQREVIIQ